MTRNDFTTDAAKSAIALVRATAHTSAAAVSDITRKAVFRVVYAHRVWRERQALARLDDRMLKDIGLTRSEIDREVNRAIFDTPPPRPSRRFRW